ncbi:MAG TPA: phosphotransferase family protein, partial [Gammaproteobacteria bacterium]|nr:phosphotransferase family protein [Gammaproteobacteria bacterium]
MEIAPEGYQVSAVEDWVRAEVPELTPPFRWTRLEGGHSNLTYQIEDARGQLAVIR